MEKAREHPALNAAPEKPRKDEEKARRRLRGLAYHLATYFAVMAVLLAVNLAFTPGSTWVLLPMVGWAPVVAIHAAYAMGLFEIFRW